jgi:capreomycidine synthase
MRMKPAALEDFLRAYYFTTTADLGSSGIRPWSMAELRDRFGWDPAELDQLVLGDSDSYGDPPLRHALADRFAGGRAGRILVTHGSTEALFLAMASLLDPGDEVVVVTPGYHALSDVAEWLGCRLRPWRLDPGRGFAPDLGDLEAVVGPRTRMVVVNFPHNPTGVTLTPGQQRELVAIAARHGSYLLWDGAFTELTYGAPALPDPSGDYPRCLSFGTLSKAYGLPGLRVGWCIGDPAVLARLLPLRDRLTICLSPLVELVARSAVEALDLLRDDGLRRAGYNRDTLIGWAAERPGRVELVPPAGGVTAFPALPGCADVDGLCRRLGDDDKTLLVPGSCFGHPDRVRLGFGGDCADFTYGLDRLATALDER